MALQVPSFLPLLPSCRLCVIKLLSSGLFLDPFQPGSCFFCYIEALFVAEALKSGLSSLELTVGPAVLEIVCLLSSGGSLGEEMVFESFLCDCPLVIYRWYTFVCYLHAGMTVCSRRISISLNFWPFSSVFILETCIFSSTFESFVFRDAIPVVSCHPCVSCY